MAADRLSSVVAATMGHIYDAARRRRVGVVAGIIQPWGLSF